MSVESPLYSADLSDSAGEGDIWLHVGGWAVCCGRELQDVFSSHDACSCILVSPVPSLSLVLVSA